MLLIPVKNNIVVVVKFNALLRVVNYVFIFRFFIRCGCQEQEEVV